MNNEFFFKTSDLTVGYDGTPLIKDINLSVKKGEILTLIGPNGSGKSTILKSITRHLNIIGGAVFIEKTDMKHLSGTEFAKKISVVLTERITPEMMTCRDVVASGRYPYTGYFGKLTKEDNEVVDESMAKVHCSELAERNFIATSDGQKQRIMLARAICQKPDIIILDEPTSYLDIKHKIEILSILREMANSGEIAVIMSLHEVDLAAKVSDKIALVKGTSINGYGTPEKIFTNKTVNDLYDIEKGSFNITFGSVELQKVSGEPKVFVLGGSGKGAVVYRYLQRKQIPFSAGILFDNDVDYQVASALSENIIYAPAFTEVKEDLIKKAENVIDNCEYVIDCHVPVYKQNSFMSELLNYAKSKNIPVKDADTIDNEKFI